MANAGEYFLDLKLLAITCVPSFQPDQSALFRCVIAQHKLQLDTGKLGLIPFKWPSQPSGTFVVTQPWEPILGNCFLYKKSKKAKYLGSFVIRLATLVDENSHNLTGEVLNQDGKALFKLTFEMQLSTSPSKGFLSEFGSPIARIPTRVRTGDLLLFSVQDMLALGTSLFTGSKWNHVAMVVGFQGEMFLLEALGDMGVKLNCASARISDEIKRNSGVGVRRLLLKDSPLVREDLARLKIFLGECLGKPYERQLLHLLRAGTGGNTDEDLNSYFCSQLVAAAYKELGFLSDKKLSNNYVPADFARSFPLLRNAQLDTIQEFSKKISDVSSATLTPFASLDLSEIATGEKVKFNQINQTGNMHSGNNLFVQEEIELNEKLTRRATSSSPIAAIGEKEGTRDEERRKGGLGLISRESGGMGFLQEIGEKEKEERSLGLRDESRAAGARGFLEEDEGEVREERSTSLLEQSRAAGGMGFVQEKEEKENGERSLGLRDQSRAAGAMGFLGDEKKEEKPLNYRDQSRAAGAMGFLGDEGGSLTIVSKPSSARGFVGDEGSLVNLGLRDQSRAAGARGFLADDTPITYPPPRKSTNYPSSPPPPLPHASSSPCHPLFHRPLSSDSPSSCLTPDRQKTRKNRDHSYSPPLASSPPFSPPPCPPADACLVNCSAEFARAQGGKGLFAEDDDLGGKLRISCNLEDAKAAGAHGFLSSSNYEESSALTPPQASVKKKRGPLFSPSSSPKKAPSKRKTAREPLSPLKFTKKEKVKETKSSQRRSPPTCGSPTQVPQSSLSPHPASRNSNPAPRSPPRSPPEPFSLPPGRVVARARSPAFSN